MERELGNTPSPVLQLKARPLLPLPNCHVKLPVLRGISQCPLSGRENEDTGTVFVYTHNYKATK
jgi:hypothetical protein